MSAMIEETASVVRVEGDAAWVRIRTRSACGHCGSSTDCGTAMVAQLFGEKENLLRLDNTLQARAGEQVVIGISNKLLLKASLLAYMAPLLAFIAAIALGQYVGMDEELSGLFGLTGLGTGLWLVNRITGGAEGRRDYCPVMLRRAAPAFTATPIEFTTGVET